MLVMFRASRIWSRLIGRSPRSAIMTVATMAMAIVTSIRVKAEDRRGESCWGVSFIG
jgi:hypothetical protein